MNFQRLVACARNIKHSQKRINEKFNLVIIDGPSAVPVSRCLADRDFEKRLRFFVPLQYQEGVSTSPNIVSLNVAWSWTSSIIGVLFYGISKWLESKKQQKTINLADSINLYQLEKFMRQNVVNIESLIIFNERNRIPSDAISIAKKLKIFTSCIQHGAVVENYFPISVDRYYTWSTYYSELLKSRVKSLDTLVVGRLNFEVLPTKSDKKRKIAPLMILQPAGVTIERNALLRHFKIIIDACYSNFDEIGIRPHPNDNLASEIYQYIGNRSFKVETGQLSELLAAYQITISVYSTVLLEAEFYGSHPVQYLENMPGDELLIRCLNRARHPSLLVEVLGEVKRNIGVHNLDESLDHDGSNFVKLARYNTFFSSLR